MQKIFKNVYLAILISIGLVLHIIESYIPIPGSLPGARIGLANIVSLITLVIYGPIVGLALAIIRPVLGGILTGAVSSIPYSLSGALFSTTIMWYSFKYLSPKLSLIGVSVLGSSAHNIGQVLMASLILSNINIIIYLPVLLIVGTFTGYFIGLIAKLTVKHLRVNIIK